jgi:nicotinamide mononucleotide (NMN) deamidase PncC
VFVAVAGPEGLARVEHRRFSGDRAAVRAGAVGTALHLLLTALGNGNVSG